MGDARVNERGFGARQIMMVPEQILASQWFNSKPHSPEQRLCRAVLEEALDCLRLRAVVYAGDRRKSLAVPRARLDQQARDWITSNDETYVFSFHNVCHALGLEPGWLRKAILNNPHLGGSHRERA